MDVRCTRCQTEYELDDALVSDRGTMVKCTNCGLQFRVQPQRGQVAGGERWIVRKADGSEVSFGAISELQRAIANKQVQSDDLLSRDNQAFRAMGSIAELEPFFAAAQGRQSAPPPGDEGTPAAPVVAGYPPAAAVPSATAAPGQALVSRTLIGISPTGSSVAPAPTAARASGKQGITLVGMTDALPKPEGPPSEQLQDDELPTRPNQDVPTRPVNALPELFAPNALPGLMGEVAVRERSAGSNPHLPSVIVSDAASVVSTQETTIVGRPAHLRWVFAFVLLGGVGLVAGTVGRDYLNREQPAQVPQQSDDSQRTSSMVQRGEQLFYQGDLEGAKAEFDKATALSEKDPVALSFLARIESVRADTVWLKLRLLPADSPEQSSTAQELGTRLTKLDVAVAAAKRATGEHPAVIRAELDALRIAGNLKDARELVPRLGSAAVEPETNYVLGALDLADEAPSWPSVIERLSGASAVERGLGRARAALIYALVSAKRDADARAELDKLALEPPTHPLLPLLKAFVTRELGEPVVEAASEPSAQPAASAAPEPAGKPAPGVVPSSDPRILLQRGAAARRAGKTEQAEQYFHMALSKSPGNVEALTALGEMAQQRGDQSTAQRHFESALSANPHYLPALVGLADIKWSQGDRGQAAELYQRVLDRTGTSTAYGARAAARLAEMGKGPAPSAPVQPATPPAVTPTSPAQPPAPAPTATATATAAPSSAPAPAPEAPHIDTSDLPEFQK
ncbi:MAG TPA: tetratricopeptide repeat protein [Polyangiaceae bacterium]|nr:tetratricopeptide repeat protein [Polyangiaceae bacterium]